MDAEPGHTTEPLLKAYAQKRRQEAGGGFEMPPATRLALIQEVHRQGAAPEPVPSVWSSMVSLWPRFATASAVTAVLCAAALVMRFQVEPVRKGTVALDMAAAREGRVADLALADAGPRNELERLSAAKPGGVADEKKDLVTNARADGAAVGGLQPMSRARTVAAAPPSPAQPLAKGAPAVAAVAVVAPIKTEVAHYAQVERERKNLLSPPVLPVLQNFEVRRTGEAVQVVDDDGSIYEGAVVADKKVLGAVDRGAGRFQFSVSGTNRVLNQMVVFDGAVLDRPVVAEEAGEKQSRPAEVARELKELRPVRQVEGRARIGGTNLVIRALPVPANPAR